MVYYEEITLESDRRSQWIDITDQVHAIVTHSKIQIGIVTASSLHTTAGLTINENADPDVQDDFFWKLNQLIPVEKRYRHREGNSDSHIKTSLMGLNVTIPINHCRLVLGTWQSVYLCEFDGPRSRRVSITIIGE